jgi:DNA polymerase (family 10)
MDNRAVAKILLEIADLLEIKGENSFRIRSYRIGAETVGHHGREVAEMVRLGEDLRSLDGIGAGIAGKIKEIVTSGDCAEHRNLLAEVPAGLLELLQIPGLGPKGVSLVWQKLGVRSAEELEAAIVAGRLRTLPGMKEKKEERLLKGLRERRSAQRRFLLPVAEEAVVRLQKHLWDAGASRVEAAGSFRRRRECVGDVDLIAVGGTPASLSEAFTSHPDVAEVLARGPEKASVVLRSGLQVDLRYSQQDAIGAALQYFTGSKAHNVALRERALRRGLKLNEYGLFRGEERIAGESEEQIYAALGLELVPPELREDRGEIQAAERSALPRLVEVADLKGDLHSHTTESDGHHSLEDMVDAARRRGLAYLAVTDHSRAIPSPKNGTGMDEARCLAHIERIRELQPRVLPFRVLAGIEVDILPDGRLDMADDVLAQLDVVVASLHSRFDMERAAMTERVLRAFENPHFQIWGHPLARLILKRDPVQIDLAQLIEAAAKRGIVLEVNGQPDRLDLPDDWIRAARDQGVRFAVSSDSHWSHSFDRHLPLGIGQARRGWLCAEDVVNCSDADTLLAKLRRAS